MRIASAKPIRPQKHADMNFQLKEVLRFAAAVLMLALALGFIASRMSDLRKGGEDGLSVWFYDESEKRLYAAPRDAIPPHEGIGGKSGDGVRAVVVACRAEQKIPAKRKIAYLETYSPELKALLDRILAERAAGQPAKGPVPSRDGDYFQNNTLVRRPGENQWHPTSTAEGRKIQAEWRQWRDVFGQALVICVP